MNDKPVIDAMFREAERLGSGKRLAKHLDISEQYLSDILNERRSVSELVAIKMGFKAVWVKVKTPQTAEKK
jgi:plasmid maintenance system antidote protein VapI